VKNTCRHQFSSIWSFKRRKKLKEYKYKLGVLPIYHTFEGLFTTSVLVLSLALEYCTFMLEFIFPQFKPPMTYKILEALYCNKLKDGNP
jgi:hypothetical protein